MPFRSSIMMPFEHKSSHAKAESLKMATRVGEVVARRMGFEPTTSRLANGRSLGFSRLH